MQQRPERRSRAVTILKMDLMEEPTVALARENGRKVNGPIEPSPMNCSCRRDPGHVSMRRDNGVIHRKSKFAPRDPVSANEIRGRQISASPLVGTGPEDQNVVALFEQPAHEWFDRLRVAMHIAILKAPQACQHRQPHIGWGIAWIAQVFHVEIDRRDRTLIERCNQRVPSYANNECGSKERKSHMPSCYFNGQCDLLRSVQKSGTCAILSAMRD